MILLGKGYFYVTEWQLARVYLLIHTYISRVHSYCKCRKRSVHSNPEHKALFHAQDVEMHFPSCNLFRESLHSNLALHLVRTVVHSNWSLPTCTRSFAMESEEPSTKRIRNDYEEEEEGKPKKIPRTLAEKTKGKRLIVVLENASLETVKVLL